MDEDLYHRVVAAKGRAEARSIAADLLQSPEQIEPLIDILQHDKKMVCQRASWPLVVLAAESPDLLHPYFPLFHKLIIDYKSHTLLRNVIRILAEIRDYGEEVEGGLFESCWAVLLDIHMPIACRVFAMTVCTNVAVKYPELAEELSSVIREHQPHGSAGFKVRARDELKRLGKASVAP
jgi:hypothetical protein